MTPDTAQEKLRDHLRNQLLTFNFDFDSQAWDTFVYQYQNNLVYQSFCDYLDRSPSKVSNVSEIPFLPISTFKSHQVQSGHFSPMQIFTSSGTTQSQRSQHRVRDVKLYEAVSKQIFESKYGALTNYEIFALLPSYLEQQQSSLVYMVHFFLKESGGQFGGFYKYNFESLIQDIDRALSTSRQVLLLGVSYALLDLAEQWGADWDNQVMVMETGGMKGRKKEMIRKELHDILCNRLGVSTIHSEYGMTELLSQLYSQGNGFFRSSVTLRLYPLELYDPLTIETGGKAARAHLIDLSNIDSCAFIATEDMVKINSSEHIEILGRLDQSEIRGCNLLYVG